MSDAYKERERMSAKEEGPQKFMGLKFPSTVMDARGCHDSDYTHAKAFWATQAAAFKTFKGTVEEWEKRYMLAVKEN